MNKIQLSELLDKYLDGTCTPEEAEAINYWYEQWQNQPDFTDSLPAGKQKLLKARMFSAIVEKTVEEEPAVIRPIYRKWWMGAAAAALLFVAFKFFILDKPAQHEPTQSITRSITNHTKNVLRQMLPDSSVVWLSPEASLNWPEKFSIKSRNVVMAGNCFFEVTKSPNRPFIITSEHIVTKVWGTSFRVLDGKNIKNAKVTVVTGKVSVSKKGHAVTTEKLTAGEVLLHPKEEVILINNSTQLTTNRQADISDLTLYDHVDLSFEKAKLPEIVSVLNKKFDVNIKIQSIELNNAVMTANLTNLNLPEVLDILKASMKLNYEISSDLIVLTKTN